MGSFFYCRKAAVGAPVPDARPSRPAPGGAPAPLPCLFSNNSTEELPKINRLTGGHKRMAHVLCGEIQALAKEFGIQRLGFLTLTFGNHVTRISEAQRRFNSLNTHVLKARYSRLITVWERQKSGRIHFHLVIVQEHDIRTGFDFDALDRFDYRSASKALRSEWSFWRQTAPKYGFGRTELLPVRSTAEGIARYVGKYVSKCIAERVSDDKGARVVRFGGYKAGDRKFCARFSWSGGNSRVWRAKLAQFTNKLGVSTYIELKLMFGNRWAWHLQESIMAEELPKNFQWENEKQYDRDFELRTHFNKLASFRQFDALTYTPADHVLRFRPNPDDAFPTGDLETSSALDLRDSASSQAEH